MACYNMEVFRKLNSNDPSVLEHMSSELVESTSVHAITDVNTYTKTLGLEWNTTTDTF